MKKYLLVAVIIIACSSTRGFAGDNEQGFLKFDVGVSLQDDLTLSHIAGIGLDNVGIEFDPGVRFGASVGVLTRTFLNDRAYWRLALESGIIWNEMSKLSGNGGSVELEGNQLAVPLLATVVFDYKVTDKLTPFVGFGGGAVLNTISLDKLANLPVEENSFTGVPAVQWNLGIAYTLSEKVDLMLEYKGLDMFGGTYDLGGIHVETKPSINNSILVGLIYRF